jgi:hypothetical protein
MASTTSTSESKGYELRHANGDVDGFSDIGDALEFQKNQFPSAVLFERVITTTVVCTPWTEVTG